MAPASEDLGHEDDVVPTTEYEILVPEGSAGPRTEDPFPKDSTVPEVEVEAPSVSLR